MKGKSVLLVLLIGLVALFFSGCADVPQEKIDSAKAALEAAKTAEADRYLKDEFNAAQDSLNAAMAEIEVQNGKFALSRDYDKAAKALDAAKMQADESASKVAARKDEVKAEVESLIPQLTAALEETKKLLKKSPRGKGEKEAIQMMGDELAAVEAGLPQINNLLTSGDFLAASDRVNAGLKKVNSINEEIQTAIAKKKGR